MLGLRMDRKKGLPPRREFGVTEEQEGLGQLTDVPRCDEPVVLRGPRPRPLRSNAIRRARVVTSADEGAAGVRSRLGEPLGNRCRTSLGTPQKPDIHPMKAGYEQDAQATSDWR